MKLSRWVMLMAMCGCTRPETPVQSTQTTSMSHITVASSASASPSLSLSSSSGPVPAPPTPTINGEPQPPGPAYVLVDYSGILEITATGATKIFPVSQIQSSSFTEITLSPAGTLWMSDFQGVRTRTLKGDMEAVRRVKDGPIYKNLVLHTEKDVWAVSSDIEWQLLHFQGNDWKPIRTRKQYAGRFDDNKFSGLAVTSEGVWVSSWNGVWRGVENQWESIPLPEGVGTGPDLLVYRDQLIVASPGAVYLRKSGAWSKLAWPENIMLRWIVSDLGLFAAPSRDKPRIIMGLVEGNQPFVESDPMLGQDILTLAFDGSGRLWAGSDKALAVFDQRGRLLVQWPLGTLDQLIGRVLDIAVVAGGPETLPAPKARRSWEVSGKFVTYRQQQPLAGANLALCSTGASDCAADPDTKRTSTDAKGNFRFSGVMDGDLRIEVHPPPGTGECETPFTLTKSWLHPHRDCHDTPGSPGQCNLGTLTTCLPFEMPPPRLPRK